MQIDRVLVGPHAIRNRVIVFLAVLFFLWARSVVLEHYEDPPLVPSLYGTEPTRVLPPMGLEERLP